MLALAGRVLNDELDEADEDDGPYSAVLDGNANDFDSSVGDPNFSMWLDEAALGSQRTPPPLLVDWIAAVILSEGIVGGSAWNSGRVVQIGSWMVQGLGTCWCSWCSQ